MSAVNGSLDANIILRLMVGDIPKQKDSVLALFQIDNSSYRVSDTAIIETVFVLDKYYKFNRKMISDSVVELISNSQIISNKQLLWKASLSYPKHPKLSFEDIYLSNLAEYENNLPLWTFDKKLSNQMTAAKLLK